MHFEHSTPKLTYLSVNAAKQMAFESTSQHHSWHMVWSKRAVMCLLYTVTLTGIETIKVIYVLDKQIDKQEVKSGKKRNQRSTLHVFILEFGI